MLLTQQESNLQPPDHQSDMHPTEPYYPAYVGWKLPLIWSHVFQIITLLKLNELITTTVDNIFISLFFLLYYRGNKAWHFM